MDIRRIKLKGFMSYYHETVFDFSEHSIWVLSGSNGSGKSTVFDAISYVLYGTTSRNMNKDELINYQADSFLIELDLRVKGRNYQAKRTVPRKGASSFQIFDLDLNRAVGDTASQSGFNQWRQENIGLNFDAFSAAVLLAQGQTDQLLSKRPAERHQLLTQIFDLSAYDRLHQKSSQKESQLTNQLTAINKQLERLQLVEGSEIERLKDNLETHQQQLEQLREREQSLLSVTVHAENWKRLNEEKITLEKKVNQQEKLLTEANHQQLSEQSERQTELSGMVPKVSRLLEHQKLVLRLQQQLTMLESDLEELTQTVNTESKKRNMLEEELATIPDYTVERTTCQTKLKQAEKMWHQLTNQVDQANCLACGQLLTAEHLAAEQKKRQADLKEHQTEYQRLIKLSEKAEQSRRSLHTKIDNLSQKGENLNRQLAHMVEGRGKYSGQIQGLKSQIEQLKIEIPVDYHQTTQQKLQIWKEELSSLSDIRLRLQQLQDARQQKQRYDDNLLRINQDLGRIPAEGQRHLGQLQKEIGQMRRQVTQQQQQINQEQQELTRKEQQLLQYQDLELQHRQLASQASIYKKLTYQLGRDRLQRHLLQKVEYEIVTRANQHLDKMSSGQLSLELGKEEQSTESEKTTSQKALDLVVYNREISSDNTFPVSSLSGSQRFRVSVALALAIGEYTTKQSSSLETLIVDEGFGSLDTRRREEMTEELLRLEQQLNRIILVSHQEEVSNAFNHRYHINLENGSSTVTRQF